MKIKEIINKGQKKLEKIEESKIKSKILLANLLEKNVTYLEINIEEEVNKEVAKKYFNKIEELASGMPLEYITNKKEFMGFSFFVNENVLIPRFDTEVLCEKIIELSKDFNVPNILDMCTGSGCIGISLKKHILSNVVLSDISSKALEVAKTNAKNLDCNLEIIQSDLFENISSSFDFIVSNPPYIKTNEICLLNKDVQCEPKIALDGGLDGLLFYRKIIDEAFNYLNESGYLVLEIGNTQANEVCKIIEKRKEYTKPQVIKDYCGNDRCIITKKK